MRGYTSRAFVTSLTLFVALLSELAAELSFASDMARLRAVWVHVKEFPEARELWKRRYSSLLATAA
jgi:hypothetical protein